MTTINDLENKMREVMIQAKECLDMSLDIARQDPEKKRLIFKHWENFIFHFLDYIKKKEKETGEQILAGVVFSKLVKYL